jgi:DNA-binding response OmpR family regulator
MSAKSTPPRLHGQRVTVGGRELVLTPTEYTLLEVLRSQPGYVFTRAELVRLVMPDAVVLERTIDVHVDARHTFEGRR